MDENKIIVDNHIKNRIYTIRNQQVILDSDLAKLYEVETFNLNKAVKRNIDRFPKDFMFQITEKEYQNLKFQIGMSKEHGGRRFLPYAFTEQGVTALSGILKSKKAIQINIKIVRTFVSLRKFISSNKFVFQRLDRVELKQLEKDKKIDQIFNVIESNEIKPKKGIFYNGQMFDAYKLVSNIIKSANKSIYLIDNYIDDSVLTLFFKRKKNVKVTIFTKK